MTTETTSPERTIPITAIKAELERHAKKNQYVVTLDRLACVVLILIENRKLPWLSDFRKLENVRGQILHIAPYKPDTEGDGSSFSLAVQRAFDQATASANARGSDAVRLEDLLVATLNEAIQLDWRSHRMCRLIRRAQEHLDKH